MEQADNGLVLVRGHESFFNASLFLNTTLQLAHRFFTLPSRALARLRRLDDMAFDLHDAAAQEHSTLSQGYRSRKFHAGGNAPSSLPLPGPWGFLTSGYFVGLFVMAFVLNRIQNIVVPPRRPFASRLHRHNADMLGPRPVSLRHVLLRTFFPVDFSSTFSRAMFRLPSVYFLSKSVLVWIALLLLAQDPALFSNMSWLRPLGDWLAKKTMEDICWSTFMSACFALCIGTLTTGLEGLNINDSAPFNLFAFAFQLYIESATRSRIQKEGEPHPRPNNHIIITILIPLVELTVMHCLEIKHRWSDWRLAFSSTSSILALSHFHYVLWFSASPYPLTTYAARVVESLMLAIITLTVVLNALTQLLTEGTLSRPLFGHAALLPKANEDFNVALFRLGTASMDATAVAGLGNEVGGVSSLRPSDVAPPVRRRRRTQRPRGSGSTSASASDGASSGAPIRGELEIDRTGVSGMRAAYDERGTRRRARAGFANEITTVRVKAAGTDFWMGTVLNVGWHREVGRFVRSVWGAAGRVWRAGAAWVTGHGASGAGYGRECGCECGPVPPRTGSADDAEVARDGGSAPVRSAVVGAGADPYAQFLRGEMVSDDEDDEEEFRPDDDEQQAQEEGGSTGSEGEEDEDGDGEDGDGDEQALLYADLSRSGTASARLLLAHMTGPSGSPLTRRGYGRLLVSEAGRAPSEEEEWDEFVRARRMAKREEGRQEAENPRMCVVCTVEARDIICWPCRCLALCDDCRNNLASRSSASKHTCPCCRRSVEGYSRIYIP